MILKQIEKKSKPTLKLTPLAKRRSVTLNISTHAKNIRKRKNEQALSKEQQFGQVRINDVQLKAR